MAAGKALTMSKGRIFGGRTIGAAAAAVIVLAGARAATFVWDEGGGNNLWRLASNWNPNGVPGSADIAQFGAAGSATTIEIDMTGTTTQNVGAMSFCPLTPFRGQSETAHSAMPGR